ncbi:MAG: stage III sporulation protein AD [Clostridia bacterium]|nr:stage III sporulation protein AD [Clostridia bacterium]
MEIIKIMGVAIVGAVSALIIKEHKPQLAIVIGIGTAVILFLMILSQVEYVLNVVTITATGLDINTEYIAAIFKMIGISYLSQFGSEICRDAGQNAIAAKVELAGKIMIVALSVPILIELMNLLVSLLPNT